MIIKGKTKIVVLAYHQIELDTDLTIFLYLRTVNIDTQLEGTIDREPVTSKRLLFKRLFFGIKCAPEIFQRIIENVHIGIKNERVFFDDREIKSPSNLSVIGFV